MPTYIDRVNLKLTYALVLALAIIASSVSSTFAQQTRARSRGTSKPATTQPANATTPTAANLTGKALPTKDAKSMNSVLEMIIGNQPDTYTAIQVTEQNNYALPNVTFFRKGKLQRVELDQVGTQVVVIARPDIQKSFTLRPDRKMYAESANASTLEGRLDPFHLEQTRTMAPRNVKIEDLGNATLNGHTCRKYRISFDQANNVQQITVWKASDLNGLIIRQEMQFLNIKSSFELQNIDFNVPADIFELPKDYQKVENNRDMFKNEQQQG